MRKTLDRAKVIEMANYKLAAPESETNTSERRYDLISFLETILMVHDSYKGFNYLTKEMLECPDDTPGINGRVGVNMSMEEKFKNTDPTRRFYYGT